MDFICFWLSLCLGCHSPSVSPACCGMWLCKVFMCVCMPLNTIAAKQLSGKEQCPSNICGLVCVCVCVHSNTDLMWCDGGGGGSIHILCCLCVKDDRWQRKCEKILEFCIKTITALAKVIPDHSLRLFLQGALAADRIGLEKEAYEFISQVCVQRAVVCVLSLADYSGISSLLVASCRPSLCLKRTSQTPRSRCVLYS